MAGDPSGALERRASSEGGTNGTELAVPSPVEQLRAVERPMLALRWFAVIFAIIQVETYYLPISERVHAVGAPTSSPTR